MPQFFQVLRCYKCSVFQVHQTRKDNKWICKLCGEKQSVKRHYGIGTAKDCRLHVQKLNNVRGEKEETIKTYISDSTDCNETAANKNNEVNIGINKTSKWNAYIDEKQILDTNEPQYLNNLEIVLEVPPKRNSSMLYSKHIKYAKKSARIKCNNSNTNTEVKEAVKDKIGSNTIPKQISLQENNLTQTVNSKTLNVSRTLNQQDSVLPLCQPCILKSSKWHQYLEKDSPNTSGEFIENCPKTDLIFSLTNDNDIDKILDL